MTFQPDPLHHPMVQRSKTARLNPTAFAILITCLLSKPHSVPELVEATGLHSWTVRAYCKALVLHQSAHIAGWYTDTLGRDVTACYRLGYGINVPRRAKSGAQKMRERRSRLRREALDTNALSLLNGSS